MHLSTQRSSQLARPSDPELSFLGLFLGRASLFFLLQSVSAPPSYKSAYTKLPIRPEDACAPRPKYRGPCPTLLLEIQTRSPKAPVRFDESYPTPHIKRHAVELGP
jgi:hypothetical protein